MKQRKLPMRMCVGCREMKPKKELVRVVRAPDGEEISLDPGGKKSGRGAYVCYRGDCLKKARKSRALERTFAVKISEEIYDDLEKKTREVEPPDDEGIQ